MAWARQEEAWERLSLIAAILTDKPAAYFQPFEDGRPRAAASRPDVLPYDPQFLIDLQKTGLAGFAQPDPQPAPPPNGQ
jgi:hypothetical protein